MLFGALLAASLSLAPTTVTLSRGTALPGEDVRYWAVEDTTLDATQPTLGLGGRAFLQGGAGKTILIRFGDLQRALGPNRRVVSARLILTAAIGQGFSLRSVHRVLEPWWEGPSQVVNFGNPNATAEAATWSATFRYRRSGPNPISWQSPGASGAADAAPIPDAKAVNVSDAEYAIEGLGPAVQAGYDFPLRDGGFALRFEQTIEFFSSQSPTNRPRLEVVTEPAAANGPDLVVTHLAKSPELPAVSQPAAETKEQDGLSVPIVPPSTGSWPAEGTPITYTATIRNRGTEPSTGFSARWGVREEWGSFAEFNRTLEPGASTTITYVAPFRRTQGDARPDFVSVEIRPNGDDPIAGRHGLQIPTAGRSVDFAAGSGTAAEAELAAQDLIRLMNETVFGHSRFSHDPGGVREVLYVGNVKVGEGSQGVLLRRSAERRAQLRDVLSALGMPLAQDLSFALPKSKTTLRPFGAFTGISGIGDTRFDGSVPPLIDLNPEPVLNEILRIVVAEPTDLLASIEVAELNSRIDSRRSVGLETLYRYPSLVAVRLLDGVGGDIVGATVEAFPAIPGKPVDVSGAPLWASTTGPRGALQLPARETLTSDARLRANPFGRIDALARNATLLLRISLKGQTDYQWLRLDHIVASALRSPAGVTLELRANLAASAVESTNLAQGRLVTDSVGGLPAQLAQATDGNDQTAIKLPEKAGEWIEIDLGRDRVVGEVRLTIPNGKKTWKAFDVMIYSTGQLATDAFRWAVESDAAWRMRAIEMPTASGTGLELAYRARPQRIRYIRLVAKQAAPGAELGEIRVFGAAPTP